MTLFYPSTFVALVHISLCEKDKYRIIHNSLIVNKIYKALYLYIVTDTDYNSACTVWGVQVTHLEDVR